MEENTELIVAEPKALATFSMAGSDAMASLTQAETVVKYMAAKCNGPRFIATIQGRSYPKVEWWTTVGAALGLFPREMSSLKTSTEPMTYEAVVEVRHGDQIISRASAICSQGERTWKGRDEYAVKSMATTRATGKAYRLAFSFMAVMAGLEPTPAEEMPAEETMEEPRRPSTAMDEIKRFVVGLSEPEKAALRERLKKGEPAETIAAELRAQVEKLDAAADEGFKEPA